MIINVNGYKIRFNDFWESWQVSHDEIGLCAEFSRLELPDAIEYCERG